VYGGGKKRINMEKS